MGPQNLKQQKHELRQRLLAKRAEAFAAHPQAATLLHNQFFRHFSQPAGIVALYHAFGSEMPIQPIGDSLAACGQLLALPVIIAKGQPLEFRLFRPGDVLIESERGILEPGLASPPVNPAMLLLPLLAFDRQGRRLGYGGGYYDRTLKLLRSQGPVTAIGVGFACQQVDAVPAGVNDQALDHVLTETGPVALEIAPAAKF